MPGEVLYGGQSLVDGSYTMVMQTDGNFVLYANGNRALWQSHTYNNPGSDVVMQTDGNLVVYSPGGQTLWQSGTYNQPGDHLVVQTDGNAVIYTPSGGAPWFTNTVQTPHRQAVSVPWRGSRHMPRLRTGTICVRRPSNTRTACTASVMVASTLP